MARTDLRIYGEMSLRDELVERIAGLQGEVQAAKEAGEDSMVRMLQGALPAALPVAVWIRLTTAMKTNTRGALLLNLAGWHGATKVAML